MFGGSSVASKSQKAQTAENLKEVIRLLNLAIEDCQRLLSEAESVVRTSGQDNAPGNPGEGRESPRADWLGDPTS